MKSDAMTWIKLHDAIAAVLRKLFTVRRDPSAYGAKGLDL
jgi:hypothetical protein